MDANCICIFNEYFEEELFDEKGQESSYFNFSGAERKNLDLACLFTFMDIRRLQGDVAYNVSVYDELLDSSLDEKGVELVVDILRERVEKLNECVIIISHRKESVKAAGDKSVNGFNDVIFLQKENGITKRIEYAE
jgi:energy-coupling factor transporter ATP-binding protein EcfA2